MPHGDITHVDIPADDIARASAFYSGLFGWSINEVPGYPGYPMWQAPNKISGGGITARQGNLQSIRSYVEVDSIDDIVAKAEGTGGSVVMKKEPISEASWWAVIRDTEGNLIGLYEGSTAGSEPSES